MAGINFPANPDVDDTFVVGKFIWRWNGTSWKASVPFGGRMPAGTTAQRPAVPRTGQIRLNTDIDAFEGYDGNAWRPFYGTIVATPEGVSPTVEDDVFTNVTFVLEANKYVNLLGLDHASSDWQISTDPAFGTTEVDISEDTSNLESYEVSGGLSDLGTFYWRVRYRDSEGNVSEWSDGVEFETANPVQTPTGTSPTTQDDVFTNVTFVLEASAYSNLAGVTHASSDWQVSTDPAFGTTEVNISEDTSNLESYEVSGGLSDLSTFYWRVRYRDSEGNVSEWSDAIEFETANPVQTPTGTSPTTSVVEDVTFVLEASAYSNLAGVTHASSDWQISTDPAFGTTEVDISEDTSNLESYEVAGGLSDLGTFYWRVRYRDSEGNVSEWSDGVEFEIVLTPPDTFGQSFGGGIYMGTICAAGRCYALIVAPNATGCAGGCQWKTTCTATSGTASLVNGFANTYNPLNNATHPAGRWCATRTINGFSDWYLPAIDELQAFYNNGANGGNESVIGSGEAFGSIAYWSSTESSANSARRLCFSCGRIFSFFKTSSGSLRAVRREPI